MREKARRLGLPTWDKADSEDICFVPEGDYVPVVERIAGADRLPAAGPIVTEAGQVLGEHGGVHRFTVGQRKGLGVAAGERLYVLSVDGPTRTIVVGQADRLAAGGLEADTLRWVAGRPPAARFAARARIRYRHPGAGAQVEVRDEGRLSVRFDAPERAVAPGQSVVLYDATRVLGGGVITRALATDEVRDAAG
ncbi:MAG: aminomethyltransferase beta-barrel domain-containing protein [bacterium]